jgi:hypothetical protein
MKTIRVAAAAILLAVSLAACATNRGEIDLRVAATPNPPGGPAVKITEVVDRRKFEIKPGEPNVPSLMNGEINDAAITRRAIARKRNAYGAALGDILLPEGRSVAQLTEEALTKALREAGYRVVAAGDPDYDKARPLQADVEQFWGWFRPGFAQITLQYEARVRLRGNWPSTAQEVRGEAKIGRGMAATEQWTEVFNAGLANLVENARAGMQRTVSELRLR